ncbi:MAG: thiosulfate oxidation carrier protein SoxY [Thiobacillus sp. 63-78]|uniref:thiosulfate oxidation carrier protein SoxY n=1 Tax=Thiobacillus sp. 63-78 TaxID=1895859 RepID=UPI000869BB1A|nr:thiosulfate oxidation carrier protein SoxY [Thiobacillus sp. 63-78]MBN8763794.1 thiosulfate oxidation carrier protein SoxY [Thiobacillus sp.]ODV12089.1 MAG: thiosulfate oxidation carrier protein SoxY [Thiobacillus sp. SCN 64-317]MBN8766354.1 thiosulfate oxidation carrier protein SoxY [Thiobacillus sp.]MBN8773722.1 thiosulfate oxidation carrier protein SoxY [Thiobacillus sp.]OJZ11756.1 MAG: thiosulfate oxidation carrier protein SoxY [Thiobacillus sp. 63-78]
MNALRRNVLKGAAGAGTVAMAVAAGLLKPTQALAGVPRSAFEAKNVGDALKNMSVSAPADSKDITIKAPDIAENGAVVPVEVTSGIPGTTAIAILAEKNATPLVADFGLMGGAEAYISTRIKMGQTSLVRAVVMAGGKAYTAAKEVKVTIGGCGG